MTKDILDKPQIHEDKLILIIFVLLYPNQSRMI